ncbi:MAG: DNRLRE domain-containing protein [Bacteroidota bacterium]
MTKSYNLLRLTLLWLTIFGLHYCLSAQELITLNPIQDNTLYETSDGSLSNGAGNHLFVGKTGTALIRRSLLQFDFSGLPNNAVVQGVRLEMNVSKSAGATNNVNLHKVLRSWGEGTSDAAGPEGMGIAATADDATWLHRRYDSERWTTPGGDFEATVSGTTVVGGTGMATWESEGMTADVNSWLVQPEQNFGWMLRGEEVETKSAHRLDARESSDAPVLYIIYTINDDDDGDDDGDDDSDDDNDDDGDDNDDDGDDNDDDGDDNDDDVDDNDDDGDDNDDDGDDNDDDGDDNDDDGDDNDDDGDDNDDDGDDNDDDDVDMNTAFLQIIHNVPDPLVSKVNIEVNGRTFANNLGFRSATAFTELPANVDVTLTVKPVLGFNNRQMTIQQRTRFDGGKRYILMVSGVIRTGQFDKTANGNAIKINVYPVSTARVASEGGAGFVDLMAFHGTTDAPMLDVVMPQINDVPVDDLSYATFTDYATVPALGGRVQLDVMDSNQSQTLSSFFGDLSLYSGQAITIFSSGFLNPRRNQNGAGFGLFAVLANGTVFPLEKGNFENRTNESMEVKRVVKLSPNPAESWVNIDLKGWQTGALELQLFTQDGKMVRSSNVQMESATKTIRWNVADLPKQTYFLRCAQGNRVITQPLGVQ